MTPNIPSLCLFSFNNLISSIKVGPGTCVVLFTKTFYRGRKLTISKNTPCIESSNGLVDHISSLRLIKLKTPISRRGNLFIIGRFKNAHTGRKLSHIKGFKLKAVGKNGRVHVAKLIRNSFVLKNLLPQQYTFYLNEPGWIKLKVKRTLTIKNSKIRGYWDFTISRPLPKNKWRFVLSWSSIPRDLDATMVLPRREKIYYRRKRSRNRLVVLDTDARRGFGPETFTLKNKLKPGEKYSFYIHNYSRRPSIVYSKARVTVYNGNHEVGNFYIPIKGRGRYWYVCDFSRHGLIPKNKIVRRIRWIR